MFNLDASENTRVDVVECYKCSLRTMIDKNLTHDLDTSVISTNGLQTLLDFLFSMQNSFNVG